jgi:hypothetical protein
VCTVGAALASSPSLSHTRTEVEERHKTLKFFRPAHERRHGRTDALIFFLQLPQITSITREFIAGLNTCAPTHDSAHVARDPLAQAARTARSYAHDAAGVQRPRLRLPLLLLTD